MDVKTETVGGATEAQENAIQEMSDRVVAGALDGTSLEAMLADFCERLDGGVMPLVRGNLSMRTLHPLLVAESRTWVRGAGIAREGFAHGESESDEWMLSPLHRLVESGDTEQRIRIEGSDDYKEFPILVDLHAVGATEYLMMLTTFSSDSHAIERRDGMMTSWTTDRPGGFTDEDIGVMRRLVPRLGVAAKMTNLAQTAENVVSAYLGSHAGRRVLDGQIKLGDGETLSAVIWYSDLRQSTTLADQLPAAEFLNVLNAYFDCTAGAVLDHGGEVLRFIGDAVLAIFSVEGPGGAERAARMALAAARDAESRMTHKNADRRARDEPVLAFGLGLHVGDVMYGNIGVPERLEFSVIGPAANEACRLEGLTKEIGRTVVVSSAFKGLLHLEWESLGRHVLRGVAAEQEIFAPPAR